MTSDKSSVDLEHLFPQTALDAVPQPMWIYGHDGFVAGCNVAAEKFWRLPRERGVGKFNLFDHAATSQGADVRVLARALRSGLAPGHPGHRAHGSGSQRGGGGGRGPVTLVRSGRALPLRARLPSASQAD